MTDIEKQHPPSGGMSAGNTLTNVRGAGEYPVGAEQGGQYPYTLGASGAQQALYQGGIPMRKFANPAPL